MSLATGQEVIYTLGDSEMSGTPSGHCHSEPLYWIQFKQSLMNTYPTADTNGTISWAEAVQFAHSSGPEFMAWFAVTYWHLMGERVDLGELEALHTDWALDRIADLVFS